VLRTHHLARIRRWASIPQILLLGYISTNPHLLAKFEGYSTSYEVNCCARFTYTCVRYVACVGYIKCEGDRGLAAYITRQCFDHGSEEHAVERGGGIQRGTDLQHRAAARRLRSADVERHTGFANRCEERLRTERLRCDRTRGFYYNHHSDDHRIRLTLRGRCFGNDPSEVQRGCVG
jgi:hypothetical protein